MKKALHSLSVAKQDNKMIRGALEAYFEGPPSKWPEPTPMEADARLRKNDLGDERKIRGALRHIGMRREQRRSNSQKRRDAYWRVIWYERGVEEKRDQDEVRWDAWCAFLDIMSPQALQEMYMKTGHAGERDMRPKTWNATRVASAATGVLVCEDLAELAEFIEWFIGRLPLPEELKSSELKKKLSEEIGCQGYSFEWLSDTADPDKMADKLMKSYPMGIKLDPTDAI